MPQTLKWLFIALTSLALSACGGGGGGGGHSGGSSSTDGGGNSGAAPLPVCDSCVLNNDTDGGTDMSVYSYENQGDSALVIPVSLSNLTRSASSTTITLLYTNQTSTPIKNFSSIALAPDLSSSSSYSDNPSDEPLQVLARSALGATEDSANFVNKIPQLITSFNPHAALMDYGSVNHSFIQLPNSNSTAPENTDRAWKYLDGNGVSRSTNCTLIKKSALTANDGSQRPLQVWVQDGEYVSGKITSGIVDKIISMLQSIYPIQTSLAGKAWGKADESFHGAFIDDDNEAEVQPLNIVFINFSPNDGTGWGLLGYFWSINDFRQSATQACLSLCQYSNEALAIFVNTDTLYSADSKNSGGEEDQRSTVAHELTHLISFYQRTVANGDDKLDPTFSTAMSETTAMMMEDVLATRINPNTSPNGGFHAIRDTRFKTWLASGGSGYGFNCDITSFGSDCNENATYIGYSESGSFGAYLLRHYGLAFYKHLLRDIPAAGHADQASLIDSALKAVKPKDAEKADNFSLALRRFGASLAGVPPVGQPEFYGYPERIEYWNVAQGADDPSANESNYATLGDQKIDLIHFDGTAYKRTFPTSAPKTLNPYSFYAVERRPKSNTYTGNVTLPAGVGLTIVAK
jgi:hypothetical protein